MSALHTVYDRVVVDYTIITIQREPLIALAVNQRIFNRIPQPPEVSAGLPIDNVIRPFRQGPFILFGRCSRIVDARTVARKGRDRAEARTLKRRHSLIIQQKGALDWH
jgi:hypothetical protein